MKHSVRSNGEAFRKGSPGHSTAIGLAILSLLLVTADRASAILEVELFPQHDGWVASFAPTTVTGPNGTGSVMRVLNSGNQETMFMKYVLPSFNPGTASDAILEIVKAGDDGNPANPTIRLYSTSIFLSDNVTPWTEGALNWNNQPTLLTQLDSNANPGDLVSPSLRSVGAAHQFSSAALDAYLNSVGAGGTASFAIVFNNVGGSAEEQFYSKDYSDPNFHPSLNFAIPEPSAALLGLLGAMALLWRRKGMNG